MCIFLIEQRAEATSADLELGAIGVLYGTQEHCAYPDTLAPDEVASFVMLKAIADQGEYSRQADVAVDQNADSGIG